MSTERDDLRDDAVARAWREHVRDTPPPALDDAIRAAARRAVGAKPRQNLRVAEARQPWRWWMPLAAAATIGAIAVGVIQNLPQDSTEPTVVSDAVTARRAPPAASAQEGAPAKQVAPAKPSPEMRDQAPLPMPRTDAPVTRKQAQKPDAAPKRAEAQSETSASFVPTPPPAVGDDRQLAAQVDERKEKVAALAKDAPQAAETPREIDALQRRKARDTAAVDAFAAAPPPASAPPPAPARAPAVAQAQRENAASTQPAAVGRLRAAEAPAAAAGARAMAEPQGMAVTPPDVFIAEIRRLIIVGDREAAARELQRFRRTHLDADARLPEDLKAFAASVPR